MRIDTARNQVGDARELLNRVLVELDDLHVLAYERLTASEDRVHVRGGSRDYALDTHGDPRVRDAYRVFSDAIGHAAQDITDAALGLLKHLSVGETAALRTPRTVTAAEHALLIAARGRRISRGEYAPRRNEHQAGTDEALQASAAEVMRLEREVARLERRLWEAEHRNEKRPTSPWTPSPYTDSRT